MIAYIKGTVEQLTKQAVILDNNGIGYIINTSPSTLSRLPTKGKPALLYTHLQVKEDDMSLFGFLTSEEIDLFCLLISVPGIGPKAATSILAVMSPEQVITAIASQDPAPFGKVTGIGKKTSQRIILELQSKINTSDSIFESADTSTGVISEKQDAIDALLSLGYSRSESVKAVLAVATTDMPVDQIIRLALKNIKL